MGRYTLLRQLGVGGMGTVSLAVSGAIGLETFCVIKRLLPELRLDRTAVERFRHEADVARRLVHGNLVQTHAVEEADGEVFLVQEFVDGRDLSAFLDRVVQEADKPERDITCYIIREVARGLAYAHSFENLGLVHCDISPSNIRLGYSGEVKLLDFGVAASRLGGAPAHDGRVGKLAYMAPEQLAGGLLTPAADIYSLGVLLWEMLTGQPLGSEMRTRGVHLPEGGRQAEVARRLRSSFDPPSRFDAAIPKQLDDLVLAMLAAAPEARPVSAEAVQTALGALIPKGFRAESVLSGLLKRYFSPELERASRAKLVEESRGGVGSAVARPPSGGTVGAAEAEGQTQRLPPDKLRRPVLVLVPLVALALVMGGVALLRKGSDDQLATWIPSEGDESRGTLQTKPANPASLAPANTAPVAPEEDAVAPTGKPASAPPTQDEVQGLGPVRIAAVPLQKPKPNPTRPPTQGPETARDDIDPSRELELAEAAFQSRQLERAVSTAKRAIAAGAGAEAHMVLGNALFKLDRLAEAESAYETAAQMSPGDPLIATRLRLVRAKLSRGSP